MSIAPTSPYSCWPNSCWPSRLLVPALVVLVSSLSLAGCDSGSDGATDEPSTDVLDAATDGGVSEVGVDTTTTPDTDSPGDTDSSEDTETGGDGDAPDSDATNPPRDAADGSDLVDTREDTDVSDLDIVDGGADGASDGSDTSIDTAEEVDAAPPCTDADGDGFGDGPGCLGPDCAPDDETRWADCDEEDGCIDNDGDGYGEGDECLGADCDDADPCGWESMSAWRDDDGDRFGVGEEVELCTTGVLPGGFAPTDGDCDDSHRWTYPGAAFMEGDACTRDEDHDGWGAETVPDGVTAGMDCDDSSVTTYGGAPELSEDGVDQSCDGEDLEFGEDTTIYHWPERSGCNDELGTAGAPTCTLAAAIELAEAEGKVVAIGPGEVHERAVTTVSLFGGFDTTWSRDLESEATLFDGAEEENVAIEVPADASVAIQGFNIVGRSPRSTVSSIGVLVRGNATIADNTMDGGYSTFENATGLVISGGYAVVVRNLVKAGHSPNDGDSRGIVVSRGGDSEGVAGAAVIAGNELLSEVEDSAAIWSNGERTVLLDNELHGTTVGLQNAIHIEAPLEEAGYALVVGNDVRPGGTEAAGGSALSIGRGVSAHIASNIFDGSEAGRRAAWATGAVSLRPASPTAHIQFVNNFVRANDSAAFTRALTIDNRGTVAHVVHNTIIAADGEDETDAVRIEGDARAHLVNNTIVMGEAGEEGQARGVYLRPFRVYDQMEAELYGNNIVGPEGGTLVEGAGRMELTSPDTIDACDWKGCRCAQGTMAVDPSFADAEAGDYSLSASSPLIDAGMNPSSRAFPVPMDLLGNARPLDGDGDGEDGFDIGAYEFVPVEE